MNPLSYLGYVGLINILNRHISIIENNVFMTTIENYQFCINNQIDNLTKLLRVV